MVYPARASHPTISIPPARYLKAWYRWKSSEGGRICQSHEGNLATMVCEPKRYFIRRRREYAAEYWESYIHATIDCAQEASSSSASNIQLSYARTTSAQDTTTQRNTVYSEFVSTPLALYLFLSLSYSTRTELRLAHPSGTLRTTPLMRLQPGENAPTSFANMIRVWSRDGKKKSILSWSL